MKVKALIECEGLGYSLDKDDIVELKPELAEKLVRFGYVEKVDEDENSNQGDGNPPGDDNKSLTVDDLPNKSGWYELPNGEKVQGREKAEEALNELLKEKGAE